MKIIGTSIVVVIGLAAGGMFRLMALTGAPETPRAARAAISQPATDSAINAACEPDETVSESEANLRAKVKLLKQGLDGLESVPGYRAVLQKQEVVAGELLDEQTMNLKCRHRPFSVYLQWETGDIGREVLYVDGQNDGRLIAHDGGWKARLPAFSLHPESTLAMADARYPVTAAGLQNLTRTMLDVHVQDLAASNFASCEKSEDRSFDGRRCTAFETHYKSRSESPEYRKSITYIDYEWNLPVYSQHFRWPQEGEEIAEQDLDQATLVESYSFTDVQLSYPLADADFDRANPEYRFR